MTESIERRLSVAVIVAATAVFGLLLVILPSYFPTFDEAKYLGIGVDIWSGHGITTACSRLPSIMCTLRPGLYATTGVLPQAPGVRDLLKRRASVGGTWTTDAFFGNEP